MDKTPADEYKEKLEEQQQSEDNTAQQEETPQEMVSGDDDVKVHERIAETLGIDPRDASKYRRELSTILKWGRSQSETDEDAVWEIRYLFKRLGSPAMGENPVKYLYRYIYLLDERSDIDTELKKYEVLK